MWPEIISSEVMTPLWWQPLKPDPPVRHALPVTLPCPTTAVGLFFALAASSASLAPAPGIQWAKGVDRATAAIRPLTSHALPMHPESNMEITIIAFPVHKNEWLLCEFPNIYGFSEQSKELYEMYTHFRQFFGSWYDLFLSYLSETIFILF